MIAQLADLGHVLATGTPNEPSDERRWDPNHEPGVGPDTAAALLIAAGDNPERLHTEASFAAMCGVSPVEMSSGKTRRHRLNRGGDRQANCALHTIVLARLR